MMQNSLYSVVDGLCRRYTPDVEFLHSYRDALTDGYYFQFKYEDRYQSVYVDRRLILSQDPMKTFQNIILSVTTLRQLATKDKNIKLINDYLGVDE